jgi:hypothetical protein
LVTPSYAQTNNTHNGNETVNAKEMPLRVSKKMAAILRNYSMIR